MRTKIVHGLLLAVVIVLGAAATRASAQEAAPGGPPPGMAAPGGDDLRARMTDFAQRAQRLRYLEDPDVRAEIGLSPEQEQKITELRERATGLITRIREDMQAKFMSRVTPDMTDEERQALRMEAMQAIGDATREAQGSFEAMLTEANTLLTPEQKEKLAVVTKERTLLDQTSGGLAVLLTQQAREQLALTRDQVAQIRVLLKGLANDGQEVRDKLFGAGKELTQEDMQSDKYKEFRTQRQDMIAKTREKILSIFGAEQREKVEQFLSSRRGFGGGRMGGMRGPRPPAGGPPATPPAPAAPAPAPAANPQ
jgi:hypothetical protein